MQHKDLVLCSSSLSVDPTNLDQVQTPDVDDDESALRAFKMHEALSALALELTVMRPTTEPLPFYRLENLSASTQALELVAHMSRHLLRKRGFQDKDFDHIKTWIAETR